MALEEAFKREYGNLKTAHEMERLLEVYEFFEEQLRDIRLSQSSIPMQYSAIMIVGKPRGDALGVSFDKSWKKLHDEIRAGTYEGFVVAYQPGSGRGLILNADQEFRAQATQKLYRVPESKKDDAQAKTQVLPALHGA